MSSLETRVGLLIAAIGPDIKVLTPKVSSFTTTSVPNPTGNYYRNILLISALTTSANILTPSGTPADGNTLIVRIDSAAAQALTYGSAYLGKGGLLALPSTTVAGKTLVMGFLYKASNSKWELVSVSQET